MTKTCQHQPDEDCMNCAECGQCREDLDDNDLCPDCQPALHEQSIEITDELTGMGDGQTDAMGEMCTRAVEVIEQLWREVDKDRLVIQALRRQVDYALDLIADNCDCNKAVQRGDEKCGPCRRAVGMNRVSKRALARLKAIQGGFPLPIYQGR